MPLLVREAVIKAAFALAKFGVRSDWAVSHFFPQANVTHAAVRAGLLAEALLKQAPASEAGGRWLGKLLLSVLCVCATPATVGACARARLCAERRKTWQLRGSWPKHGKNAVADIVRTLEAFSLL